MQVGWFGFRQKSNGNNFELYTPFYLEPMKRFECRSDVCMLRSAGDGANECILNLLKKFYLDHRK